MSLADFIFGVALVGDAAGEVIGAGDLQGGLGDQAERVQGAADQVPAGQASHANAHGATDDQDRQEGLEGGEHGGEGDGDLDDADRAGGIGKDDRHGEGAGSAARQVGLMHDRAWPGPG